MVWISRPPERVLIDGVEVSGLSAQVLAVVRRRKVGFVFQDFNLIPSLTAIENVAIPLELDGVGAKPATEHALAALSTVGLEKVAERFPDELSGGQRQRVAIARALVGERQLVLADEPTGALDSRTGETVLEVLRDRCDAGAAGLLVTHEARHAAWADRVLFLRDGMTVDATAQPMSPTSCSERRTEAVLSPAHAARPTRFVRFARWRQSWRLALRLPGVTPGRTRAAAC